MGQAPCPGRSRRRPSLTPTRRPCCAAPGSMLFGKSRVSAGFPMGACRWSSGALTWARGSCPCVPGSHAAARARPWCALGKVSRLLAPPWPSGCGAGCGALPACSLVGFGQTRRLTPHSQRRRGPGQRLAATGPPRAGARRGPWSPRPQGCGNRRLEGGALMVSLGVRARLPHRTDPPARSCPPNSPPPPEGSSLLGPSCGGGCSPLGGRGAPGQRSLKLFVVPLGSQARARIHRGHFWPASHATPLSHQCPGSHPLSLSRTCGERSHQPSLHLSSAVSHKPLAPTAASRFKRTPPPRLQESRSSSRAGSDPVLI